MNKLRPGQDAGVFINLYDFDKPPADRLAEVVLVVRYGSIQRQPYPEAQLRVFEGFKCAEYAKKLAEKLGLPIQIWECDTYPDGDRLVSEYTPE